MCKKKSQEIQTKYWLKATKLMNGSIKHQEIDSNSAEQNVRRVGDEELLSQIAQGDRQAFSRLYLKYQPR